MSEKRARELADAIYSRHGDIRSRQPAFVPDEILRRRVPRIRTFWAELPVPLCILAAGFGFGSMFVADQPTLWLPVVVIALVLLGAGVGIGAWVMGDK